MKYAVILLEATEWDLLDIHQYIEQGDSQESADLLLDGLERVIASLDSMPERGHIPLELERIGVRDYRELHFKPYRIIYIIEGDAVIVYCVLDGRRDMQTLLQHRVLRR